MLLSLSSRTLTRAINFNVMLTHVSLCPDNVYMVLPLRGLNVGTAQVFPAFFTPLNSLCSAQQLEHA
jgi:hypothetical protein